MPQCRKKVLHFCVAAITSIANNLDLHNQEFEMSNLDDINKLMKDMIGNFPIDTVGVEKAFKSSAI